MLPAVILPVLTFKRFGSPKENDFKLIQDPTCRYDGVEVMVCPLGGVATSKAPHTNCFPGCQKSLTKHTEELKTQPMQHQHAAVQLARNTVTKPHLHLR